MKRPTDKQRLDWLTNQSEHMELAIDLDEHRRDGLGWSLTEQERLYSTPRAAIDAAMAEERKRRMK